ncbi:hypothetical protein HanPI659440_Chr02g0039751 [Helianthus annuus]|nr:hypothetical protein HanPI659440_Chr02g0039751 [Helianthus annuus]
MVMNHMINYVLDRVVPHASLVMLAFAWPTLTFIKSCERVYYHFFAESMDDKVVVITGASSGIGEVRTCVTCLFDFIDRTVNESNIL